MGFFFPVSFFEKGWKLENGGERHGVFFVLLCVCVFFYYYYFVLWNVIYLFLGVLCVLSLGWTWGGMALWRGEKVEPCGEGNERESWEDEEKGEL